MKLDLPILAASMLCIQLSTKHLLVYSANCVENTKHPSRYWSHVAMVTSSRAQDEDLRVQRAP